MMTNPIEARSEEQQEQRRSPTVKDYLKAEAMEETNVFDERPGDSATLHCKTPRQIVSKWVMKFRLKKDKLHSFKSENNPTLDAHPTVSGAKTLTSLESG